MKIKNTTPKVSRIVKQYSMSKVVRTDRTATQFICPPWRNVFPDKTLGKKTNTSGSLRLWGTEDAEKR
ncbi:MAG: hypothetical protein QXI12_01910 [Candidatus Methanomethyliaceae archaeon]